MTPVLQVRDLSKHYPGFSLENASFSLMPGKIVGFVGRNGEGKSTTINCILDLVRADGGEVRFWGAPDGSGGAGLRQKVGFVSSGMTLYSKKRIKTITDVTRSFYPEWDERLYREYMAQFQLDERKTPAQLSQGMRLKYALALALSHGARLLILDEPTSGLDPVSREELRRIFLKLRQQGITILFSTHITSDLEQCADEIIYIRRGRILCQDTLEGFAAHYGGGSLEQIMVKLELEA